MKALLKYRPDLRACELEDRLLPVALNLGATVLTSGGYVLLLSSFPVIEADPLGRSGGPGFLTPSALSVSLGITGLLPGNSPGVPSLVTTAPTASNGGAAVTINVGSGASDAGAANIPPVTRNTVANDALTAAPVIGRLSGDQSAVLPPDQVYRGDLPVTATVGFSFVIGRSSGDQSAVLPPDQFYRGGLPVTATVGFSLEVPDQRAAQDTAQAPADPLPLRLRRRPHRLASGASGNLIRSHADRAP